MSYRPPRISIWSPFALTFLMIIFLAVPTEGAQSQHSSQQTHIILSKPYLQKAQQAIEISQWKEAIEILQHAAQLDRDNIEIYHLLAQSHKALQEYTQAEDYFLIALSINSAHEETHEQLGKLYLEVKELLKAKHHLDKLSDQCWFYCKAYDSLKIAIVAFERLHLKTS